VQEAMADANVRGFTCGVEFDLYLQQWAEL